MIVLGFDLETSGLNPNKDRIIEVGAVLWCTKTHRPLQIFSQLVYWDDLKIDEEVVRLTGFTDEDAKNFGGPLEKALYEVASLAHRAEYVVAHNGNQFDRKFMERAWQIYPDTRIDLPWIDTLCDLPFNEKITSRKLNHLAADHGFVNPFSHRAIFDVLTMLKVLAQYRIEDVVALSQSPLCRVYARVTFDQKDLAKKEGFRWDPGQRLWYLDIKEIHLSSKAFPFEVYRDDASAT